MSTIREEIMKYNDFKHLTRLAVVAIVFLGVGLVVKTLLVPESFGRFGHYRGDSVQENMEIPIKYMGHYVCKECHESIYNTKTNSKHKGVNCETCHGPGVNHIVEVKKIHRETIKSIIRPTSKESCILCHSINTVRRKDFPQVDIKKHNTEEKCVSCHDPHDPL
ncbi:MAG: hypothetical protein AABY84_03205 [Candidatus Firestonebacteria bacterium]